MSKREYTCLCVGTALYCMHLEPNTYYAFLVAADSEFDSVFCICLLDSADTVKMLARAEAQSRLG